MSKQTCWPIPEEKISLGVIDSDTKGQNGGIQYWTTQTIHLRVTDSREDFLKKAEEAYNIIKNNLVKGE